MYVFNDGDFVKDLKCSKSYGVCCCFYNFYEFYKEEKIVHVFSKC